MARDLKCSRVARIKRLPNEFIHGQVSPATLRKASNDTFSVNEFL